MIESHETDLDEEEFEFTLQVLNEAIEKLNDFRSIEGTIIENDFILRLQIIMDHLKDLEQYEQDRVKMLKDRILKSLNSTFSNENIDKNRFEQELLYYLERLDITEEKVRLKQHCDYFIDELKTKVLSKSKN
ncbi:MAG: DUF1732 domain-containing protein [Saprospiraceae bacterium]|nr:DUF1732 domain-containing protein [Candidatus Vicinibacter affinis]